MDQNSTDYPSGSNTGAGNSALGAGTDSLSVTGTGAGQSAASGSLTPSQGGSQGMGGQDAQFGNQLGNDFSSNLGASQGTHKLGDRLHDAKGQAADKLSQARDMAGERLGQAKEKATELKATLADKLDQGAQSLRQQGGAQQFAGANGATASAEGLHKYAGPAADAMEKSAQFLRDGDLKSAIEEQVRTAPGRTLLIAVGLGYMLGKAIRR